jgi:polygalacturonase
MVIWLFLPAVLTAKNFNILDFGAKGDGTTLDSVAIQKAIDAAAATTNGRVIIPRWKKFLVGTIQLKSGIDFHLNGELIISTNPADYFNDAVITATNAVNLKITGSGKISGRSLEFMTSYDAAGEWWLFKEWRPKLFVLTSCTNLTVRDITFGDAPFWGLHMLGCENVLVDNVTVNNRLDVPNDDGIGPDHCRNVEIKNCNVTCGDDAIVVKSTRQTSDFGDCTNIHVHDCKILTQDAGLKIGTETVGRIHDVLFERCQILSSSRGLCIQLRDEGEISNVTFRDIHFVSRYHADPWWGRGEAISLTAFQRTNFVPPGKLHDVLVQNVSGSAENSVRINGSANCEIKNVTLKNVSVNFSRWTKYAGGVYDNRPTKVLTPVESHATDGFNIRHAKNVFLEQCKANWAINSPASFQNSVTAENSTDIKIFCFSGESASHPIILK